VGWPLGDAGTVDVSVSADGLDGLFCRAHIRRYFVRAGDANPGQLTYWTRRWLERIRTLYATHEELMTAV
jgi:transposase